MEGQIFCNGNTNFSKFQYIFVRINKHKQKQNMKTLSVKLFALILLVSLSSCSMMKKNKVVVNGNGNIDNKEYTIGDYSSIILDSNQEIYYEQRASLQPYIRIEADENLLQYITPEIKSKALTFKYLVPVSATTFKVYTNSRDLATVKLTGTGNVYLDGATKVKDLKIEIAGSGSVFVENIQAKSVNVRISGAGAAILAGISGKVNYTITGSGNIKGIELKTNEATCRLSGAGNIWVNTTMKLSANLSGSGDIYYVGKPVDFRRKGNGIGTISSID